LLLSAKATQSSIVNSTSAAITGWTKISNAKILTNIVRILPHTFGKTPLLITAISPFRYIPELSGFYYTKPLLSIY
jgi:hypothetical protein